MYIELGNIEQYITSIDSLGQKIALSIYLALRVITYITQIIFIQNRHEKQPLKARGRHILFLLIFGTSLVEFIFIFRIVYGRRIFSCFVYTFIQFLSIHSKFLKLKK
jgi:hypothetical protein